MEKVTMTDEMYEILAQLDDANKKALKEPWNFQWQEQTFEAVMTFKERFGFNFDENTDILKQYKARRDAEKTNNIDDGLKVGVKFNKNLPGEIAFSMNPEPMIILNWDKITESEFKAIKEGTVDFRITYFEGITFVLTKFGGLRWMDAPYSPWLDGDLPLSAIISPQDGINLKIVLIDAKTNIIKLVRDVKLDYGTSRRLISCVQVQLETKFDHDAYLKKLNDIYSKFKTSALVAMSNETTI